MTIRRHETVTAATPLPAEGSTTCMIEKRIPAGQRCHERGPWCGDGLKVLQECHFRPLMSDVMDLEVNTEHGQQQR